MHNLYFFSAVISSFLLLMLLIRNFKHWVNSGKIKLDKLIRETTQVNAIDLSIVDYFQGKVIGFDAFKDRLVFIDHDKKTALVDIADVSKIKLIRKLISIQLEFTFNDQNADPLTITFYNRFNDGILMRKRLGEKALYWKVLLNKTLTTNVNGLPSYVQFT